MIWQLQKQQKNNCTVQILTLLIGYQSGLLVRTLNCCCGRWENTIVSWRDYWRKWDTAAEQSCWNGWFLSWDMHGREVGKWIQTHEIGWMFSCSCIVAFAKVLSVAGQMELHTQTHASTHKTHIPNWLRLWLTSTVNFLIKMSILLHITISLSVTIAFHTLHKCFQHFCHD